MSTPRLFSVLRRKVGLIDLITPIRPQAEGVAQYRLKTDTSPTGAFATTVMTVPNTGKVDPAVQGAQHVIQPGENVRMIFKPSNFSLSDTDALWLKLVYVDASNAEMTSPAPSAATLVLPPVSNGTMFGFTATAPNQATMANSVQIDLPRTMSNFRITNNETTNPLFLAFDPGGPEVKVPFGKDVSSLNGMASTIFARATGGTAEFSVSFTLSTPR